MYVLPSLEQILRSGDAGSYGKCMFSFIRNFQIFSQSGCVGNFIFPSVLSKSSSCSIFLSTLDIGNLFHFSHLGGRQWYLIVVSNLPFSGE